MSDTSRRNFIAAAGLGAAAVGTVVVAGSAEAAPKATSAKQPVMVLIDDHRKSELRLLVGEREVVVNDRALVQRILNAAGGK